MPIHETSSAFAGIVLRLIMIVTSSFAPIFFVSTTTTIALAAMAPGANDEGQVVSSKGAVLAGVDVTAYRRSGERLWSTSTDKQGRFEVREEGPHKELRGDIDSVVLIARNPDGIGWFDIENHARKLQASDKKSSNQATAVATKQLNRDVHPAIEIVLLPFDMNITGQFVDPDNRPVAGVRVQATELMHPANLYVSLFTYGVWDEMPFPNAISDPKGHFSVRLPKGAVRELKTYVPDWVTQSLVLSDKPELRRIHLAPAGKIAGQVTDAISNKPVAGAIISAGGLTSKGRAGFYGNVLTDAGGRFLLGGLAPENFNVQLRAVLKNSRLVAPLQKAVEVVPGETQTVDFRLIEGHRLHGRVVEAESGKPTAGALVIARVSLLPNDTTISTFRMSRSNDRGEFEIFVPPGICHVRADMAGREWHADSQRTLDLSSAASVPMSATELVLKMGPSSKQGAFGGGGLGGGSAAATHGTKTPDHARRKVDDKKDPAPRNSRLVVTLRTQRENPDAPDTSKLPPIGTHIVRRVYGETSFVGQTSVRLGEQFEEEFNSREFGRKATLLIDVPGYTPTKSAEFTISPEMAPLSVDLEPAVIAMVRGQVVDSADRPVVNARVRARRIFHGSSSEFPWGPEATTNADGRFELKHLRVGERIILRAELPGVGQAETKPLAIDKGAAEAGITTTLRFERATTRLSSENDSP